MRYVAMLVVAYVMTAAPIGAQNDAASAAEPWKTRPQADPAEVAEAMKDLREQIEEAKQREEALRAENAELKRVHEVNVATIERFNQENEEYEREWWRAFVLLIAIVVLVNVMAGLFVRYYVLPRWYRPIAAPKKT